MSLESAALDELCCDFPGHRAARFDETPGALCAALRNGDIVAFCQAHSQFLIRRGIKLRTLDEVRAEYQRLHGIASPEERMIASECMAKKLEEDFIASLR